MTANIFANLPYSNMDGRGVEGLELDPSTYEHMVDGDAELGPRKIIKELYHYSDDELERVFDAATALMMRLIAERGLNGWADTMSQPEGRAILLWAALDTATIWERG